ncbi:hypothetical protein N7541_011925 [Penicillium brevicompactum]|uniref:FAD/NAD(P)-binding domain-containing protein n=1 Tax=Penicillium brevicompactum TaxID=5074 RepID=A0A9W9ULC5_PENBR|nr:hypothetical protein N7541_011925 [Penicillium brevicompactum]
MDQTSDNEVRKSARYDEERQKRWRSDGPFQYTSYGDNSSDNEAIPEDLGSQKGLMEKIRVLIVGAGFGGLLFAVRLLESGFVLANEIMFVDAAGGFGGTWWWNRYPGLACDVESYIYMPLLEETDYMPSQKYASGRELKEHAHRIAEHWKLGDRGLFNATVDKLVWNDQDGEWTSRIRQDGQPAQHIVSDFVILATGLLDAPKIPKLNGLDQYEGKVFHTSRWDYDYTGGTPENPALSRLEDKTVGFVGTGASAIQAIPHLAKSAKKLIVFQRTSSAVDLRNNCVPDLALRQWIKQTGTGWQKRRRENFNAFVSNETPLPEANLVADKWTTMPSFSMLIGGPQAHESDYGERMSKTDLHRQDSLRRRITDIVVDPETAYNLQPWYHGWCKRPCFSDTFLETFNQPNVILVDTNGKGVKDVTAKGIRIDEKEFELDAIIFGTGYILGGGADRGSIPIIGRGSQTFQQKCQSGLATLHGVCTNGFPNLFMPGPYQAGASVNQVYVLDELAIHVAHIISQVSNANVQKSDKTSSRFSVEPSVEAENEWTWKVLSRAGALKGLLNCTPGYWNREGLQLSGDQAILAARFSIWGEGIKSFVTQIEDWRNNGQLDGLEIVSR